jgi:hypothetical protein
MRQAGQDEFSFRAQYPMRFRNHDRRVIEIQQVENVIRDKVVELPVWLV